MLRVKSNKVQPKSDILRLKYHICKPRTLTHIEHEINQHVQTFMHYMARMPVRYFWKYHIRTTSIRIFVCTRMYVYVKVGVRMCTGM